nr:hypothetical protein [Tanacetum cinerariifolium]
MVELMVVVQIRVEDFGNPRGGRKTRGGGDGFEGPGDQLSMNSRKDGPSLSSDDEDKEDVTEGEATLFPFSLLEFLTMYKGFMTRSWNVNLANGLMARGFLWRTTNIVDVEFVRVSLKLRLSGSRNGDVVLTRSCLRPKKLLLG